MVRYSICGYERSDDTTREDADGDKSCDAPKSFKLNYFVDVTKVGDRRSGATLCYERTVTCDT